MQAIAITLHLWAAVIWVGGMFFAYLVLRPTAAAQLEPPQRLTLWAGVFGRFFPWVWLTILTLLGTGFGLMFSGAGFGGSPLFVKLMMAGGIVMMLIFMHVFFAPYRRLLQAVDTQDWPAGGRQLNQIRALVAVNLALGLAVTALGAGGRFISGF